MSKLFVYGVNARCPREELERKFGSCGEIEDIYITGKGYAFVTMVDDEGASNAIQNLNGTTIDGQEIKVDNARARDDRGGGGGGERYGRGGGFGGGGFGGGGGRGYGGGRGGPPRGRGGGRGCYNCHQEGHIARECPEGDRRQEM